MPTNFIVTVLIMITTSIQAQARTDLNVLCQNISTIESGDDYGAVGDKGKSLGAWQMKKAAWDCANNWRVKNGSFAIARADWRSKTNQHLIAMAYLMYLRDRFNVAGFHDPSPRDYYIAWCWGITRYQKINFDISRVPRSVRTTAEYVKNLYENPKKQK